MDRKKIEQLEDKFLLCRTRRNHAMHLFTPLMEPPPWGKRLSWMCSDCGMIRHDIIDYTGGLSSRRYEQPEGYKWVGEKLTSNDLRLELLYRYTGQTMPRRRKGA